MWIFGEMVGKIWLFAFPTAILVDKYTFLRKDYHAKPYKTNLSGAVAFRLTLDGFATPPRLLLSENEMKYKLSGYLSYTKLMGYELFSCKPQLIEVVKGKGMPNTSHFRTCGETEFYIPLKLAEKEKPVLQHGQMQEIEIQVTVQRKGEIESPKPEYKKTEVHVVW